MSTNNQNSKTFSPIGQLFQESWSTFTQSVLSLFILNILGIAIFLGLGVIAILIFIISGLGSTLLKDGLSGITANFFSSSTIIATIIFSVILGIIGAIIGSALHIGSILLVDNQGKISIKSAFNKSLSLVIPLFIVNILIFFLTVGAFFVFIIPAILFYFLLVFTQFEVVLNNQRWTAAVNRSVSIVSKHFGAILVRIIILALIYLGNTILISLLSKISTETAIFVNIISIIINLLLGWFTLAYLVTLYKQIDKDKVAGKGILWMYILALIGWIIAVAVIFGGWKLFSSEQFKNFMKQSDKSVGTSIQRSIDEMKPEAQVYYQTSAQLFKQMRESQNNPEMVKKLNDENIAALKKAAQIDPNNPKIWFELGNAYTWISTIGTLDDSLNAYKQAEALDPDNVIYIDNVGESLIKMKQYDKAVLQLQRSLRIGQQTGDESGLTHYRLGLAYAGLRIYDSSRTHLQQALEILTKRNKDGYFDETILNIQKDLSNLPK